MILLWLNARTRVGGGELAQFGKAGLVAQTCVWVFVVWWSAFAREDKTSWKKRGSAMARRIKSTVG